MKIRLSEVTVHFPTTQKILFRIPKWEIAEGSQVLVEGPSGCGKTTLLHLLAGLFIPSEGFVLVGEQNLKFLSEDQRGDLRRANFGLIFQRFNLIDHLTALENVQLTLSLAGSLEKASEALAKLGLGEKLNQRVSALSTGEQQRVAVARVLASRPKIILADEPTSSLDEANANQVIEALQSLTGSTLVVVSHDQRLRARFPSVQEFASVVTA